MNIGMLWFDNDPQRDLTAKVAEAAEYYRKKYGRLPTVCFVNPVMSAQKKLKTGSIEVKTSETILPNHLWIGRKGSKQ